MPVKDDEGHKVYYLVEADDVLTSLEHLKFLIQDGIDADHRPADESEPELQRYADRLAPKHA